MVARCSEDGGKTWGDRIHIANLRDILTLNERTKPPVTIDHAGSRSKTKRIFSIMVCSQKVTEAFGMSGQKETMYQTIDGKTYRVLYREGGAGLGNTVMSMP